MFLSVERKPVQFKMALAREKVTPAVNVKKKQSTNLNQVVVNSSFIKQHLIENGGRVSVSELGVETTTLQKSQYMASSSSDGSKYVTLLLGKQLCYYYCRKGKCDNASKCDRLHVCRYFISGLCKNETICGQSHSFHNEDNRHILQKLNLTEQSDDNIKSLIRNSLPKLCGGYNLGQCSNSACSYLHLCQNHVEEQCSSGCHLSHEIKDPHNKNICQKYNLNVALPYKYILVTILLPYDDDDYDDENNDVTTLLPGFNAVDLVELKSFSHDDDTDVDNYDDEDDNDDDDDDDDDDGKITISLPGSDAVDLVELETFSNDDEDDDGDTDVDNGDDNDNDDDDKNQADESISTLYTEVSGKNDWYHQAVDNEITCEGQVLEDVPVMLLDVKDGEPSGGSQDQALKTKKRNRRRKNRQDQHNVKIDNEDATDDVPAQYTAAKDNSKRTGGNRWRGNRGIGYTRNRHGHQGRGNGPPLVRASRGGEIRYRRRGDRGMGAGGSGPRGRGFRGMGDGRYGPTGHDSWEMGACGYGSAGRGFRGMGNDRHAGQGGRDGHPVPTKFNEGAGILGSYPTHAANVPRNMYTGTGVCHPYYQTSVDCIPSLLESDRRSNYEYRRCGGDDDDDRTSIYSESSRTSDTSSFLDGDESCANRKHCSERKRGQRCRRRGRRGQQAGNIGNQFSRNPEETLPPPVSEPAISEVFQIIVRDYNGKAFISKLESHTDVFKDGINVKKWLQKHWKNFILSKIEPSDEIEVMAFESRFRICFSYSTPRGCSKVTCEYSHVCRQYVSGHCRFGDKCKYAHNFDDSVTKKNVQSLNLGCFSDKELLVLMRNCIPFLCKNYNRDGCKDTNCSELHLCKGYIKNDKGLCRISGYIDIECERSHDFKSSEAKNVLSKYRLDHMDEGPLRKTILFHPEEEVMNERMHVHGRGSLRSEAWSFDNIFAVSSSASVAVGKSDIPKAVTPSSPASVAVGKSDIPKAVTSSSASVAVGKSDIPKALTPSSASVAVGKSDIPKAVTPSSASVAVGKSDIPKAVTPSSSASVAVGKSDIPKAVTPSSASVAVGKSDIPKAVTSSSASVAVGKSDIPKAVTPSSASVAVGKSDIPKAVTPSSSTSAPVPDVHINAYDASICVDNIYGECQQGQLCGSHHCIMPYQWIYSTYHGERHKFPDHVSEMIESAYCNVKQQSFQKWQGVTGANIDLDLDFDVMNGTISGQYCGRNELNLFVRIERLSTLSQVETINKSSDLSTKWIWYWKDNGNIWKPYSNSQNPGEANNDEIEAAKLRGDNEYRFAAGRYHYILNFSKMQQQNQDERYKTTRDVRRRPVYVGSDAVKQIKRSPRHKIPTLVESTCTGLPSNWEVMPAGKDLAQYHLSPGSRDFQRVEDLFRKTMPSSNSTIERIERIQNVELWEHYQSMKKHMKRKQPGQEIEKQLFHGTEKSSVQKICKQNFDFRISGKHATVYGEGAYFARNASYSDSYSRKDDSGYQYMFLANVLVGRYTKGHSLYKRPPEFDSASETLYDSCVDSNYSPSIFIVFDLYQCYPEYLITYTKDLFVSHQPQQSSTGKTNSSCTVM